jgi:hypothetical protein
MPPDYALQRGTIVPVQRMHRGGPGPFTWISLCLWLAVVACPCAASESNPEREPTELDEVLIKGKRGLEVLRLQMIRLEDEFYARYNQLNSSDLYDIHCAEEARTGTRFRRRYCRPNFAARAHEVEGQGYWEAAERMLRVPPMPWDPPIPAIPAIQLRQKEFREEMIQTTTRHPELLELLRKRAELAARYEKLRRESFGIDNADEQ